MPMKRRDVLVEAHFISFSGNSPTKFAMRLHTGSSRGVATTFFWGDGFIGTQTHIPQKFSFSSDFGHFILKMEENAKFSSVSRKRMLKYHHFWGDVPR